MMDKPQIGVIGMAVMGKNLALNIESRGYSVAIFNRTASKTEKTAADHPDKNLVPSYSLKDFASSLQTPRRIILMVKAGQPTDETIKKLLPYLERGDVLIDGGNTFFENTKGLYVAAVGDGMGTGKKAHTRSNMVMNLLECLYDDHPEHESVLQIINSFWV